jgi:hypothetical protein
MRDVATRSSFMHLGTYYPPILLDGIHTAANLGIENLKARIEHSQPFEKWHATALDYSSDHLKEMGKNSVYITQNEMMTRLSPGSAREERELLLKEGKFDQLLSQDAMRAELKRKMTLLDILKMQVQTPILNDYVVICDADYAPIDHVHNASMVATSGLCLAGGVHIDDILRRKADWAHYKLNPKRKEGPPLSLHCFRWVDMALGYIKGEPRADEQISIVIESDEGEVEA